MSLRAIWIFKSPTSTEIEKLLFFRYFPTVEKRLRDEHQTLYVKLPDNAEFTAALLFQLGLSKKSSKFIDSRDSCKKNDQRPVFEVTTSSGKHWPIIVIEQIGFLLCCLPQVILENGERPPLIAIPGVSVGFSLLCGMADYLRSLSNMELSARIGQLTAFLTEAAPFGTVRDYNADSISAKLSGKTYAVSKTQKQPAWRPVLHKGKSNIHLTVTEYIRAVQYCSDTLADCWDLYGTVSCKADLEGGMPDVTLNISHTSTDGNAIPLDHLLINPCVQSADSATLESDQSMREPRVAPRRVRFTPLIDSFNLVHYTASRLKDLPIKGDLQIKGDSKLASISLKLWLGDKVKNMFEYCELQIPFLNQGIINNHDSNSSQGTVITSPDKKILVWNIGQKFSKSLEASLSSTVVFIDSSQKTTKQSLDPFAAGQNTYAQLYFKIPDFTHSGCHIDPKSIQVSPSTKFKLTTVREYQSVEYKIWNSLGDALAIPPPPHNLM